MSDRESDVESTPSSPSPLSTRVATGVDRFAERWRPVSGAFDLGWRHSHVGGLFAAGERAVTGSRLVQWLTREPDPDVVVIDLAETRTVGPILRALESVAARVDPTPQSSAVRRAIGHTAADLERNVVPLASAGLLGLVLGTLTITWEGAEPLWLAALAIAGVAGLLGLAVEQSSAALADSTVHTWVAALLAPPEERSG